MRRTLRIHRLNVIREVIIDLVALDLEGRCELAVFDGEVAFQDRELLDLFDARKVLVHLFDVRLDARAELGAVVKGVRVFAIRGRPGLACFGVDRDERTEVFPLSPSGSRRAPNCAVLADYVARNVNRKRLWWRPPAAPRRVGE